MIFSEKCPQLIFIIFFASTKQYKQKCLLKMNNVTASLNKQIRPENFISCV